MPDPIVITGDTSQITQSITELGKSITALGKNAKPISIFDIKEQQFLKKEVNTALTEMGKKYTENRDTISSMMEEQSRLKQGSAKELKIRHDIIKAFKEQVKLSQQIKDTKGGGGGGAGGGGGGGFGPLMALGAATAVFAMGAKRFNQYLASTDDRIRAMGLDISATEQRRGSAKDLARVGLTEDEMIRRRLEVTASGGREAGNFESVYQRAEFERATGVEKGLLDSIVGQLRPSMGAGQVNDTEEKLRASILSSGVKDAVGPFLQTIADLLVQVNDTGLTQTDELVQMFAGLVEGGGRTQEQLAKTFSNLHDAIKGSSGEANAFFQLAFAKAGIGGGSFGGTRLAMESGGLFGLNEDKLGALGLNEGMMAQFKDQGLFRGMQGEGGEPGVPEAILSEVRKRAGLGKGERLGDIEDKSKLDRMTLLVNSLIGTKGYDGALTVKLLEQIEAGEITPDQATKTYEEERERSPEFKKLNDINASIAGVTNAVDRVGKTVDTRLGEALSTPFNAIKSFQATIAKGVTRIANVFPEMDYLMPEIGSSAPSIGTEAADMMAGKENDLSRAIKVVTDNLTLGFTAGGDNIAEFFGMGNVGGTPQTRSKPATSTSEISAQTKELQVAITPLITSIDGLAKEFKKRQPPIAVPGQKTAGDKISSLTN